MGWRDTVARLAGGSSLPVIASSNGLVRPGGVKSGPELFAPHVREWLTSGLSSPQAAAEGLPAWLAVISRLADGVGMSPLVVYRGPREDRDMADDHPVAELLRRPGDGYNAFTFRADLAASLAASGNAYVRKFKAGGRVVELMVLDPRRVRPERVAGRIVFRDETADVPVTRTSDEIIHVRRMSLWGGLVGVSPVEALRRRVQTGLRREQYESAYFANDGRPGIVITFPQDVGRTQVQQFLTDWNADHAGPENAGKASALGGGAGLEVIPPIALADAQFVEAERLTIQTIAGMYAVPSALVGDGVDVSENDRHQFATFALGPMFTAIETALSADRDLFPPGEPVFVEHNADRLNRATTASRFEAHSKARQGGWKSLNEIRRDENLPPVEGGDTVQLTPVGGPVDRTATNDTAQT